MFDFTDKTNNWLLARSEEILNLSGFLTVEDEAELDAIDAEFKRRDS